MTLRDRFASHFGEMLAVSVEAAVERHVPDLKLALDRGSDPFQFALIWAIGLACLSDPAFRTEHGVTVPWELFRDWCAASDILACFDGTFDWGSYAAGRFEGILPPPSEEGMECGWEAKLAWQLATSPRGG
jgi:hypothetical protein